MYVAFATSPLFPCIATVHLGAFRKEMRKQALRNLHLVGQKLVREPKRKNNVKEKGGKQRQNFKEKAKQLESIQESKEKN
uniref:Uncharacterized protein n=1 Tax=Gossypium raimondii TaxID=29730 RepID=A0A0D2TLP5_GOSRA|nr:hypothetical protein B456_007G265200 [Gossypium raimondii]